MILYNLAIRLLALSYRVVAWFNPKAQAFVKGRKKLFQQLSNDFAQNDAPVIWIHCASLGEFEQGRPLIERLKADYPGHKIMLSFFSPSGYEIQKKYAHADWVYYLPWDTPTNAQRWIDTIRPVLVLFVKYEFWYNYAAQLHHRNIPLLSVSCNFRPDQVYFKSYGGFFRNILRQFNHFFVQNQKSKDLLRTIHLENVTVAGDTRFDRVYQILQRQEQVEIAARFKGSHTGFVIGSCWPEDLAVLASFINDNEGKIKFILAPHEINASFINEIERSLEVKSIRFSQVKSSETSLDPFTVLIIDNIGMLSRLYQYGEFAYVGGAFGKGLHNILEAACQGIPVFFGNKNYEKFEEARELIMRGGAFEIGDYSDLKQKFELMVSRPENFLLACEVTKAYVNENLGATTKVLNYCKPYLEQA